MKTTKLALATLALAGLAALANTAAASPDFHVSLRFGAPAPVAYCPPVAPVVRYAPPVDVGYRHAPAPVFGYERPDRPAGYWKEVVVKVWVPARFIDTRGRHGRIVRTIEPGYFTYRTDRVWVSTHCG
ncbi:MAG: hypothetical protein HZA93_27095 [Verrucomicrobia bacterium]|nr:hypothetical protein [Verrucomicrobiota bacterium]